MLVPYSAQSDYMFESSGHVVKKKKPTKMHEILIVY